MHSTELKRKHECHRNSPFLLQLDKLTNNGQRVNTRTGVLHIDVMEMKKKGNQIIEEKKKRKLKRNKMINSAGEVGKFEN